MTVFILRFIPQIHLQYSLVIFMLYIQLNVNVLSQCIILCSFTMNIAHV